MAKPLLSRNLVQNTHQTTPDTTKSKPSYSNRAFLTPPKRSHTSIVVWSTPKKTSDFKDQVQLSNQLAEHSTTQRLLFRKIQKAFDKKNVQLATAQRQIQALKARIETIRPRKRKKVDLSPNSKFANIEDIHQAQLAVGEAESSLDGESDSESLSEAGSCIRVVIS